MFGESWVVDVHLCHSFFKLVVTKFSQFVNILQKLTLVLLILIFSVLQISVALILLSVF